eukprot:scpid94624/ scgid12019/ C-Myc-binding protein; Associate of Myc 1
MASSGNSQWKTPDAKRDEFRRYLEKAGVLDGLTKVLVNLYEEPERPTQPLGFLAEQLTGSSFVDVPTLQQENFELKNKVQKLEDQNRELQAGIEELTNPPPEA